MFDLRTDKNLDDLLDENGSFGSKVSSTIFNYRLKIEVKWQTILFSEVLGALKIKNIYVDIQNIEYSINLKIVLSERDSLMSISLQCQLSLSSTVL